MQLQRGWIASRGGAGRASGLRSPGSTCLCAESRNPGLCHSLALAASPRLAAHGFREAKMVPRSRYLPVIFAMLLTCLTFVGRSPGADAFARGSATIEVDGEGGAGV